MLKESNSMTHKLLFVDDDEAVLEAIAEQLEFAGFTVFKTASRVEAEQLWENNPGINIGLIDLQLMDDKEQEEPRTTGFRIISSLNKISQSTNRNSVFAAFSAYDDHANLAEAIKAGCDGFISKQWSPSKIINCIKQLIKRDNVGILEKILEHKTPYTAGHCDRVAQFCTKIIPFMQSIDGRNFDLCACLTAAQIHDIGKISIPDFIIQGTQAHLTREERKIIHRHVEVEDMLYPMDAAFHKIAEIIRYHHLFYKDPGENLYDYPKNTMEGSSAPRGKDIPIESRIIKVADAVDAVLSDRLYRPGVTNVQVKEIVRKNQETGQFDPEAADAFLRFLSQETADAEVKEILKTGKIKKTHILQLNYEAQSITLGILDKIIEFLSDIYLKEGRAVDRVHTKEGSAIVYQDGLLQLTIIGEKADIKALFDILETRMKERIVIKEKEAYKEFTEMDIASFFMRKSIPVKIVYRENDNPNILAEFSIL